MANSKTETTGALVARQLTTAQKPFQEGEAKYWINNSQSLTEYYHTYSVLFPEGENFFTRSVLAYARHPAVAGNRKLLEDVRGFVSQEVHHASTHIRFNKIVAARYGHDTEGISNLVKQLLSVPETCPSPLGDTKTNSLGATCSLEHFTAILGEIMLKSEAGMTMLRQMEPSQRAMWIYHAIEESEHKAVAFDVYVAVGGSYYRRVWLHVVVTLLFVLVSTAIYLRFMWDGGALFSVGEHVRLLYYQFGLPGVFSSVPAIWAEYFRRDFHPSDSGEQRWLAPWIQVISKGSVVSDEDLRWVQQQQQQQQQQNNPKKAK